MRRLSTLMTTDLEAMFDANRGNAEVLESLARELEARAEPGASDASVLRLRRDVERQRLALRAERGRVADLFGTEAAPRRVRLDWLRASKGEGE